MTKGACRMTRLTPQANDLPRTKSTSVWTAKVESTELRKEDFVRLFKKDPLEHVGLGWFLPLGVKHPLDLKHRDGVALEKSGQVLLVEQFHRI